MAFCAYLQIKYHRDITLVIFNAAGCSTAGNLTFAREPYLFLLWAANTKKEASVAITTY